MLYPKPALDAILAYDYTPRQAEFLWLVATFSGHFLARHYQRFAQVERGTSTSNFISHALGRGHIVEYEYGPNWPRYHLRSRPFYTAIGQANNNHRRDRSLTQINQKMAQLDYVIEHQDYTFLPDEDTRVAHFQSLGIAPALFPCKTYPATKRGGAPLSRYFVDKFPLAVAPHLMFSYVDEYALSLPSFDTHLQQYLPMLRALRAPFTFVFLSPVKARFVDAEHRFAGAIAGTPTVPCDPDMERYFHIKQALAAEDWGALKKQDYIDKPALAARFDTPEHAATYQAWLQGSLPKPAQGSVQPLSATFEVYVPPTLPEPKQYTGRGV
jgi:hypothetical protein